MASITWDTRLARIAQSRSDMCIFSHDCGNCRKILNNGTVYVGQNAFMQSGGQFNWSSAVQAWLNEIQYFVYGSPSGSSTGNWADIGHYSQIINDGVYAVGCGVTNCGTSFYAYCNYASGQYGTSQPYSNGTVCANCDLSSCSNNLCSCNKVCQNYGTLNTLNCTCQCQPYATGELCEKLICDKNDTTYGCWGAGNSLYCTYSNTVAACPFTCGICSVPIAAVNMLTTVSVATPGVTTVKITTINNFGSKFTNFKILTILLIVLSIFTYNQ